MNVPDPRIFTGAGTNAVRIGGRETFDLVYHGTMVERLGVDLIVRAVRLLGERIPELRLHLWGNGDDLAAFQALARALKVEDRVRFKADGYPLHELPEQLKIMDVGVAGNRRSVAGDLMLPVKLMEYVSLGIPVVAPRLKTIEYYFSQEMVCFYEPEDVASMAEAILGLYAAPDLRRRKAAAAAGFLREHGWQRQGADLVEFYRELVES
jgi:glycosyltransferase involved in cell wall biosynthesis